MNKFKLRTTAVFSALVFLILISTMLLSIGAMMLIYHLGILDNQHRIIPIMVFLVISILFGTILSWLFGKRPVKLIEEISDATMEIAKGNFNLRLKENISAAELRMMAHNFNIMAKELSGTEMLRNDFIENVSHEFKTPLSAIEGYTMLLQKKGLTEEKKIEYTQRILHNTQRLSFLTGNILLLSRLENQEIGIRKELYCLDEQLREIILLFEEQWTSKNLDLEIDLDNADYYGNKELLAQVWQNILGNAIKFVSDNGKIGIRLHRSAGKITVSISDNGIGMNQETIDRIYEKFYQGDPSRASQGNGLGLTLAKRIVDLHNGTIHVSSIEGNGSTFIIELPNSNN